MESIPGRRMDDPVPAGLYEKGIPQRCEPECVWDGGNNSLFPSQAVCGDMVLDLYRVHPSVAGVPWARRGDLLPFNREADGFEAESVGGAWLGQGVAGGLDGRRRSTDIATVYCMK